MNKIRHCFLLLTFISLNVMAQQQLFVGVQSEWGGGLTSIENKGSILKSKSIPWQINTGILLQYRIANSFAIEVGTSIDNFIWKTYDKDFKARYDGRFETNIKNKIGSPSFFANLQYAFKLRETEFRFGNYIYLQLGGGYHKYGENVLSQSKSLTLDGDVVESMTMTTSYTKGAYFVSPEIGFLKLNNSNNFSIGLKTAFNLKNNLSTSSYSIVAENGSTVSSDQLTATGSYIGLNIKFNLSLLYIEQKEKTSKEKEVKEVKEKVEKQKKEKTPKEKTKPEKPERKTENKEVEKTKEQPTVIEKPKTDTVKPKPMVKDTIVSTPKPDTVQLSVEGRDYTIDTSIVVHNQEITIYAWDNKKIDGDRINLLFNGKFLLKNYTLTGSKKTITVKLQEGDNHLVLYALNLGEYPPNTAAIKVFDNEKFQEIILNSTMEKSGALNIYYKP